MTLWESPLRNLRVAAVLSGALAALAFLNSLDNGFAYDDLPIIQENPAIQSLETLPEAVMSPYWPGEYGRGLGLWRPLTTGVYGLQWALWGGAPVGFHLVNVLLHAGVTAMAVLVLGQVLPVGSALLAGLLFAVHPVHVEAVSNVVGMAELLSAFFFLLACLIIQRRGRRLGLWSLLTVLSLYALAFLTKESAVTLLGVVLLLDSTQVDLRSRELGRYLRDRWPLYGGMAVVAGLLLLARYRILGSLARPFAPLGADLLEQIPRIWTVASTWPHVFRLLFFPKDLSSDYSPAVIPISMGWNLANVLGVLLVLATLVLALASWRRGSAGRGLASSRALGWGVVWFVITISPTSNLVFLSGILLSERTLYLPSVGFVAALAWLLMRFRQERPRLALSLILLILSLMAVRSWTRTPTWKDNLEVFNTLVADHPEAGRSQWVLGDVYFQVGRVSEALRSYRLAIGIIGGHYTLLGEVGKRLAGEGYDQPAELILRYAWEDRPDLGFAPGLLATIYNRQGLWEKAEAAARASLADDPVQPVQYHILARALEAQGRLDEAVEARWGAIRNGEGEHWEQWGWLAELEMARGDSLAARRALDSARAHAGGPGESRGMERFFRGLGLLEVEDSVSDPARDLQNTIPLHRPLPAPWSP